MATKKRRLPRYPWDKWFARGTFRLRRGKDFHCMLHSMSVQVREAAAKRGLSVSVHIKESTLHVETSNA